MNDLKELLERALADGHGPDPVSSVDPTGDLVRGHALRRRRRLRATAVAVSAGGVAVAVAVPLVLRVGDGTAASGTPAVPVTTSSGPTAAGTSPLPLRSVVLVAYEGTQPPGYRVSQVPSGWEIQGGNAYALVLAPRGFPDRSVDSFVGKLVVMLDSADAPGLPATGSGTGNVAVTVHGRPGVFHVEDGRTGAPTTGTCFVLKQGATAARSAMREGWSTLTDEQRRRRMAQFTASWTEPVPCASLPVPTPDPTAGTAGSAFVPTQSLIYRLPDGRQMAIQAPVSLGWDAARLVRFAEGVEVLAGARAGRG